MPILLIVLSWIDYTVINNNSQSRCAYHVLSRVLWILYVLFYLMFHTYSMKEELLASPCYRGGDRGPER